MPINALLLLAVKFLALFIVWFLGDKIVSAIPGATGVIHTIWLVICCLIGIWLVLPLLGVG